MSTSELRGLDRPARRFAGRTLLVLLGLALAVHALNIRTVGDRLEGQLRLHAVVVADQLLAPAVVDGVVPDDVIMRIVTDDPQVTDLEVVVGTPTDLPPLPTDSPSVRDVVPIGDGQLTAVVTQDATAVRATATELTRQVTLVVAGGLLVLWLAVVPLARRLGRELRDQAASLLAQRDQLRDQRDELRDQSDLLRDQRDELRTSRDQLEEQGAELRRLLDREQVTVRRLREVDQLRDDFLASVSHELRTPVTVVNGTLESLTKHGAAMPEEMREQLLGGALAKAKRMDDLVVGLLEMNGSLGEPATPEPVAIAAAITDALAQLPPCDVRPELGIEAIVTDRIRFTRAIRHLIGNAVRHAPDSGEIVVRTVAAGAGVEVQVDDAGPGVADVLKHEVFDPFRHGDIADAHAPGIGMGLPIVARFAADHGGRAWLTDRPGGGTRAHLLLEDVEVAEVAAPAGEVAGGAAVQDEVAAGAPGRGAPRRVRRVVRRVARAGDDATGGE